MIVDTSAVVAILFEERDAELCARALAEADSCRMSAVSFVEAAVVVDTQTKDKGSRHFDALIRRAGIAIEPVSEPGRVNTSQSQVFTTKVEFRAAAATMREQPTIRHRRGRGRGSPFAL